MTNQTIKMYRDKIRRVLQALHSPDLQLDKLSDDQYLEEYLHYLYKVVQQDYPELHLIILYISVGLLTFGHIDFLSDAVNSYKQIISSAKPNQHGVGLFSSFYDLFPIPKKLIKKISGRTIMERVEETEEWILKHKQNLKWDKENEVYVLKDSSIEEE